MSRKLLIPLLAAAFLAAPAFAPAAMTGFSDSAAAATTVHGTKSNSSERTKRIGKIKQPRGTARAVTVHGTKSNSSQFRMGGGGGGKGAAGRAVTVHGTKSNGASFRY